MKKIALTSLVTLSIVSQVSATLLASFDLGDNVAPADPSAPVSGPAGTPATWDVIHGGNFNAPPTQNGIQFYVSNSSGFNDSRAGHNDLMSDGVYELNGGDGANWHLAGLISGETYQVFFVGEDGTGFGAANTYNTAFSVYDADPGANGSGVGGVTLLDSVDVNPVDTSGTGGFDGNWVDGVNYGMIEFTANSSTMYGLWEKLAAGSHSGIGAVQVVQVVPEPSSSALIFLGCASLLLRRKR